MAGTPDATVRGYYMYTLALACKDQGDDGKADALLNEARAMGPAALGADLYRSVIDALG